MSKKKMSIKQKMITLMMICWFLPFSMLIGVAAHYILSNHFNSQLQGEVEQLVFNNQISVERLNYGIIASRKATYDGILESGWHKYQYDQEKRYHLNQIWKTYLSREYRKNQCFSAVILWSYEEEENINCSVYNSSAAGTSQTVQIYWDEDHERIKEYLNNLDTYLGYYYVDGRLYMVRNLLDQSYKKFGAIIMRLDQSYCFGPLINSPLGEDVTVQLNEQIILLKGNAVTGKIREISASEKPKGFEYVNDDLYFFDTRKEEDFTLITMMRADQTTLQTPVYGYSILFFGMILSLFPLLAILLRVFRRNVTQPIAGLMEGARNVEQGHIGYQITSDPGSIEFQYLTDSFNQMSERLKFQFDHIYQEELALRDAKMMALQSHINPHFMNNTLEIINWEARLGGNTKVSKMIEALSTLMDAAVNRNKNTTVTLLEEMTYVDAYLYINSVRFEKRLVVIKDLNQELMKYKVPRLILQPVIENAIAHGVQMRGYGTVQITGKTDDKFLYLDIINDGTLSEDDKNRISKFLSPDCDASRGAIGNVGIANVNQRLKILYGSECGLTVLMLDENHVISRLTILIQD